MPRSVKEPKPFWDLRSESRDDDCASIFTHPIITILIILLTVCLLFWGFWLVSRYLSGAETNLNRLWWQTSATFVAVSLLSMAIPYRLRFAWNVYGISFVLLMLQNAAFTLLFPVYSK